MRHPDFNMSFNAATSFLSRRRFHFMPHTVFALNLTQDAAQNKFAEIVNHTSDDDTLESLYVSQPELVKLYNQFTLHPTVTDWTCVMARELHMQAYYEAKRANKVFNNTFAEVYAHYTSINAHGVIEGHLPSKVALSDFLCVMVPENQVTKVKQLLENHLAVSSVNDLVKSYKILPNSSVAASQLQAQKDFFMACMQQLSALPKLNGFCFDLYTNKQQDSFIPFPLDNPGKCMLRFEAQGRHLRLTFSPTMEQSRNKQNHRVYFVALGAFKNRFCFLKDNNMEGDAKALKVKIEKPNICNTESFAKYWVKINNGIIEVGMNEETPSNVLMSWIDPQPLLIKYVAVSNYEHKCVFKNFDIQ